METMKCKCAVIKDLLPLYVDDIVSEESREVVKEHLTTCADCKRYHEKLKEDAEAPIKKNAVDGKEAIRKIRNKIKRKKIAAICITAMLTAAVALGLYYMIFVKQSYLSYEESGLYVENADLFTREPYYCYYGFGSPQEDTVFVYLSTTEYEKNKKRNEAVLVDDLQREVTIFDGEKESKELSVVKHIYYVPQEYVKRMKDGYWVMGDTYSEYMEMNQARLKELKKASILIWEEK